MEGIRLQNTQTMQLRTICDSDKNTLDLILTLPIDVHHDALPTSDANAREKRKVPTTDLLGLSTFGNWSFLHTVLGHADVHGKSLQQVALHRPFPPLLSLQ